MQRGAETATSFCTRHRYRCGVCIFEAVRRCYLSQRRYTFARSSARELRYALDRSITERREKPAQHCAHAYIFPDSVSMLPRGSTDSMGLRVAALAGRRTLGHRVGQGARVAMTAPQAVATIGQLRQYTLAPHWCLSLSVRKTKHSRQLCSRRARLLNE